MLILMFDLENLPAKDLQTLVTNELSKIFKIAFHFQ